MFIKPSVYWALLFVFVSSLTLAAQGPAKLCNEQPPIPIDDIIQKFADKEKEFRAARANYVYRQDIRVQTLNANDRVTGEWHQVWDITFDPSGRRVEKVVSAPPDTLQA